MLYINDEIEKTKLSDFECLIENISSQRKEKVSQLHFFKDKRLSLLAYSLLQEGLKYEYSITTPPVFIFNEFGKPFLKDFPDIFFNLSHCSSGVVCVIGKEPIGIDIEEIKTIDWQLAEYVCNEDEIDEITKSHDPSLSFTVIWTKKESLCKCQGKGIPTKENLKKLSQNYHKFHFETIVNSQKNYVVSVCRKKN